MNGYFSRLIQQTGISLGPARDPGSDISEQSSRSPSNQDSAAPFQIAETEIIEHSREGENISQDFELNAERMENQDPQFQTNDKTPFSIKEYFEKPAVTKNERTQHNLDLIDDNKASRYHQDHIPESKMLEQRKEKSEGKKPTVFNIDIPWSPDSDKPHLETGTAELREKDDIPRFQMNESSLLGVKEYFENPALIAKKEITQHNLDLIDNNKASRYDPNHMPESKMSEQPDSDKPHQETDIAELLEREDIVEGSAGEDYIRPSIKHSFSIDQDSKKDIALNQGFSSVNWKSNKQTQRDYLKEVHEWIAGTGAVSEKKENIDIKKTIMIGQRMLEEKQFKSSDKNRMLSDSYPEGSKQSREPEIRDLNLSIGTISLIVEEPQIKNQNIESPKIIEVKSKPGKESGTSRLSRHYIRIG